MCELVFYLYRLNGEDQDCSLVEVQHWAALAMLLPQEAERRITSMSGSHCNMASPRFMNSIWMGEKKHHAPSRN